MKNNNDDLTIHEIVELAQNNDNWLKYNKSKWEHIALWTSLALGLITFFIISLLLPDGTVTNTEYINSSNQPFPLDDIDNYDITYASEHDKQISKLNTLISVIAGLIIAIANFLFQFNVMYKRFFYHKQYNKKLNEIKSRR